MGQLAVRQRPSSHSKHKPFPAAKDDMETDTFSFCQVDLLINTWRLPSAGHLLDANLLPCFGGPAYEFDSHPSTELQVLEGD